MLGTVPPPLAAGCGGHFRRSALGSAAARCPRAIPSCGVYGAEAFDRRTPCIRQRLSSCRSRGSDRKSTRLNSSHGYISYAVFCLKKKKKKKREYTCNM